MDIYIVPESGNMKIFEFHATRVLSVLGLRHRLLLLHLLLLSHILFCKTGTNPLHVVHELITATVDASLLFTLQRSRAEPINTSLKAALRQAIVHHLRILHLEICTKQYNSFRNVWNYSDTDEHDENDDLIKGKWWKREGTCSSWSMSIRRACSASESWGVIPIAFIMRKQTVIKEIYLRLPAAECDSQVICSTLTILLYLLDTTSANVVEGCGLVDAARNSVQTSSRSRFRTPSRSHLCRRFWLVTV